MEWIWFVVAIVAITQIGDLVKKWLSLQAKANRTSPDQEARMHELEQRVATLERIATDKQTQLKQTIDAL